MKNNFKLAPRLVLSSCLLIPLAAAYAHHSASTFFDRNGRIDIDGQVTQVQWRNPHVRFTVKTVNKAGAAELWNVEGADVTSLQIRGVPNGLIHIGDKVKVSGRPALRGKHAIWSTNVLLPDGREILVYQYSKRLWSDKTIGETNETTKRVAVRRPDASGGLFTVWSFGGGFENTFDIGVWGVPSEQLTPAGKAKRDKYSPTKDNPFISCIRGIPELMTGTGPWEFVKQGDTILLRFGEFDIVRPILMNADAEKKRPPKSKHGPRGAVGYSVGRWEDDKTLVVRTTGMNFPYYDQGGLPQTADAELIERWTLRDEGNALRYELTVLDPATFTQPIKQATTWVWKPGVKIELYDCDKKYAAPK